MMGRRGYYWILLSSIALLVVACAPMRMGVQEATLEKLLEQQAHCDTLRNKGFEKEISDDTEQKRMMLKCQKQDHHI